MAYKTAIFAVILAIGLQMVSVSTLGAKIERLTTHVLLFNLRALLLPPKVSSQLKIFSFDDRTAAGVGDFDLSLREWADVLSSINEREPKRIVVDKLFDKNYPPDQIDYFKSLSAAWREKVSIISFVSKNEIPFRNKLDLSAIAKPLSELMEIDDLLESGQDQYAVPYGANSELLHAVGIPGHAVYDGDGRFRPVYMVGRNQFIPHVGLTGAQKIKIDRSGIAVENLRIASSMSSSIPINFGSRREFDKASFSMLAVINRVRQKLEISVVEKGDTVLILPAMYTGNTDWRETPFGSMPGGLMVASILNSSMTGVWASDIDDPGIIVFGIFLLVALFGRYCATIRFILACTLLSGAWIVVASLLFILSNFLIPVALPMISVFVSTSLIVIFKTQRAHLAQTRIRAELDAASKLQSTFVPVESIESSQIRILSFSTPASECGGDWWGHTLGEDGCHYVYIGDAIGHGMPAALVTAVSFAVSETILLSTKNRVDFSDLPNQIMNALNGVLLRLKSEFAQMTFQIIRINPESMKIQVFSAGHTFPFVFPRNSDDDRLKPGKRSISVLSRGNFLGSENTARFGSSEMALRDGDKIVAYTDGIIENRKHGSKSVFGREGIKKVGESAVEMAFKDFYFAIKNGYEEHMKLHLPDDDATLVSIEFNQASK